MTPMCEYCKYFVEIRVQDLDARIGQCRERPPVVVPYTVEGGWNILRNLNDTMWPMVKASDFCGHFQTR